MSMTVWARAINEHAWEALRRTPALALPLSLAKPPFVDELKAVLIEAQGGEVERSAWSELLGEALLEPGDLGALTPVGDARDAALAAALQRLEHAGVELEEDPGGYGPMLAVPADALAKLGSLPAEWSVVLDQARTMGGALLVFVA
ncbi:MAG: hypothetical protein ACOZQL_06155 [Myxococcota bacterium]